MDRQQVMALLGLALFGLVGCSDDSVTVRHFQGPGGAVVLDSEENSPFQRPVGLVSNGRGGGITLVDPARGWLLSSNPGAPFLADPQLATGDSRLLGDIAVYGMPEGETVWVYVADHWSGNLLKVPWISGVKGSIPVGVTPEHDASEAAPTLSDVTLRVGRTTTESWTLTWQEDGWRVEGSVSGNQPDLAMPGERFESENAEIAFQAPSGSSGDVLSFSTDNGVREVDLGGEIQSLLRVPGTDLLVATVLDLETGEGRIVLWDILYEAVLDSMRPMAASVPNRLAIDPTRSVLYVSDAAQSSIYEFVIEQGRHAGGATLSWVDTIGASAPVSEMVFLGTEDYQRLFVAQEGELSVGIFDLEAEAWLDASPQTLAVEGVSMGSAVTGLAATPRAVETPQATSWGGVYRDHVVAVSTLAGELWFIAGETGCLVEDTVGPYAFLDPEGSFVDAGADSDPLLDTSGFAQRPVQVYSCGGVVRDEDWVSTYDEVRGVWVVEGSVSGVQQQVAREDERFVSDDGTISFLIRSGGKPSTSGDRFRWSTVAGAAGISGVDRNGDGREDLALRLPGRPVPFVMSAGYEPDPTWVVPEVGVIWPIVNSDLTLVVDVGDVSTTAVID
ncbi:MAG: hypothetical protein VX519_12650 [Myxococcota bacterium]|nr:hypothetical protein [Myxococcota bacterium]